jgi:transcriptional regulator with XRE-family HTH domain
MSESDQITGRQIAAARTLAGINQDELAQRANISVPTLRRMEASDGAAAGLSNNVAAVRAALEAAGVEFTNGGQPGVRLNLQPIVSMVKDGTYEIRIPIPGRARPHLLPRSFQTEDLAHGWLQSSEGAALVDRVRGKYVKTSAGTISAEELNASNDD